MSAQADVSESSTDLPRGAPRPVVRLERQAHGGALRRGGPRPAGPGRPPSVLRDRLRGSYSERLSFLSAVVDGTAMQRIEVPLLAVLPHVTCPHCGAGPVESRDGPSAALVTIEGKASASVKDRLAALEQMAKYGLGQLREVSVETVRERVRETLALIALHCTPEQAEAIYQALEPVWK